MSVGSASSPAVGQIASVPSQHLPGPEGKQHRLMLVYLHTSNFNHKYI